MAQLEQRYQTGITGTAAFQRVMVVHTSDYPDVPLLEFGAMMASGSGGESLSVAAFPSDDVLRILPSVARRCAENRGLAPPKVFLLTEPEVESAFASASEAKTDLVVMRQPPRLARWTLRHADCSICFVPSKMPSSISRMLVCIDLNAAGKHLMTQTARLYQAVGADEVLALHVYYAETVYSHDSVRAERMKQLQHFVHKTGQAGVSCTPLLEESARPYRTFARVAAEQAADLVVVGRRMGEFSFDKRQFTAHCSIPVLQLLLPKTKLGLRDLVRHVFADPEPTFG